MTNKELIDGVIKYYSEARDSLYNDSRISRGRKHSISSKTEDLIAHYLKENLRNKELTFLVDYPITFKSRTEKTKKGEPKSKTIYPDIAIVCNNTIVNVIDVKMDLGFKRNIKEFLDTALETVNDLREIKTATYKKIDELNNKTKESYPIHFSNDLKWHIVVVSNQNISEKKREENKNIIKDTCFESPLNYYVLSSGRHPNGGSPIIEDVEFSNLLNSLS